MPRLYRHKTRGWQIHYILYYPDGTEQRKYKYFSAKDRALGAFGDIEELESRSLKNDLERDDLIYCVRCGYLRREEAEALLGGRPLEIPTLKKLADRFLQMSIADHTRATHKTNVTRIATLLSFFGESTPANTVTGDDVKNFRQHRRTAGIAKGTVNKEMTKLAQLLDIAIADRAINRNPAREIQRYKETKARKPRALSRDEIATLLESAEKRTDLMRGLAHPIIMMYLYTGMRRNELLWLETEDIDFERRRITIQEKTDFRTKTGRARVIGFSKHLLSIAGQIAQNRGYVFSGDKPIMSPDSVTHAFKKIVRAAKLPETITLHSLRHTYITHLLEAGVNPRRVQELAGHTDFSTTWEYSHVLPSVEIAEDLLDFSPILVGQPSAENKESETG